MDASVIFYSVFLVGSLTGLGVSIRSLFLTSDQMGKNRQLLSDLENSEHMHVHDALEEAKKRAKSTINGRVSMPAFISGTTARGSTVARNALSKKKRTLSEQVAKDANKDYPVLIKNFYMSPVYWFGWN